MYSFLFCRLWYVLVRLLVWRKYRCVLVGPSSGRVKARCAETHDRTGSFGTLQVGVCLKEVYGGSVYGEDIIVGAENSGQCGDLGSRSGHGMI